jgi:large subunit ribosomal protein L10
MPTPKKEAIVKDLAERVGRANAILLADYKGLNVARMTELRRRLRAADAELTVVKNNLIRLSLKESDWSTAGEELHGPTSVTLAFGEAPLVAKVLKTFARDNNDLPVVKAIGFDGVVHPGEFLATLAAMPTREEALGMLAGVLNSIIASSARVFNALREKVEAQGVATPGALAAEAPAADAAPAPAGSETPANNEPAAEASADESPAAATGAAGDEPEGEA